MDRARKLPAGATPLQGCCSHNDRLNLSRAWKPQHHQQLMEAAKTNEEESGQRQQRRGRMLSSLLRGHSCAAACAGML